MTSKTHDGPELTDGVDTHGVTHHAAMIDSIDRTSPTGSFPPRSAATATCWTGCVATAH